MRRRAIADRYKKGLQGTSLITPVIANENVPNYHVYTVKVSDRRDELKQYLYECQIQTDVFYPFPHHLHPVYKHLNYNKGDFPHAEAVGGLVLSLPMYPELEESVVDFICERIHSFYREA
jgi:dTDP-4-amino-4,6-dideoxygalactose transaminase